MKYVIAAVLVATLAGCSVNVVVAPHANLLIDSDKQEVLK